MCRTVALLLALIMVAGMTGCGRAKSKPFPVSGQVMYKNKPLSEAVVTFHPKSGQAPGYPISATTDAEGRFRLTTLAATDGAPQGEYVVTVVLLEKRRDGDEVLRNGRNLLPAKYAAPESSGISVVVKPQENALEPFKLAE